jgi:hypothetical protein
MSQPVLGITESDKKGAAVSACARPARSAGTRISEVSKMSEDIMVEKKGLVDALDRIARELMRSSKFKESLIIILSNIDPPAARSLVRTLFWEDPGVLLSFFGALPNILNVGGEAMAEMVVQMNSLPPTLLQDFTEKIVSGLNGAVVGEAVGGMVNLTKELRAEESPFVEGMSSLRDEFSRAYRETAGEAPLISGLEDWMATVAERAKDSESATYAFIKEAGKAMKSNPDFVKYVLKPLLEPALKAPTPRKKSTAKKSTAKTAQASKAEKAEEE